MLLSIAINRLPVVGYFLQNINPNRAVRPIPFEETGRVGLPKLSSIEMGPVWHYNTTAR